MVNWLISETIHLADWVLNEADWFMHSFLTFCVFIYLFTRYFSAKKLACEAQYKIWICY